MKAGAAIPGVQTTVSYHDVRAYYAVRDAAGGYERDWGYGNQISATYWRLRDELVFPAVAEFLMLRAEMPSVLEVGSGHGHELAKMALLGIPQGQLVGVDLVEHRVLRARALYPGISFQVGDATKLPFPDASFDVVTQFTCFMHAQDAVTHASMCAEVARVLKPEGMILWWDLAPPAPGAVLWQKLLNIVTLRPIRAKARQAAKGDGRVEQDTARNGKTGPFRVSPQDLHGRFGGFQVRARPAGLRFDSWKRIWPYSRALAEFLWRSGVLAEHCFAVIIKPT